MLFRRLAAIASFLSLAAVALPASAAWCFCVLPSDPVKFGSCAGKYNHQGPVADLNACSAACQSAGLTGPKIAADADWNAETTECDWQYQNECLGPNAAQTSNKCKAELQKFKDAGTAAKNQALGSSTKGSTIGLTLPMSAVSPQQVIGRVIKAVLGIVGTLAFLMFLYGGFRWMVARGRPDQITMAKQTIIWATLGLIVIFAAYGLVNTLISGVSGVSQ